MGAKRAESLALVVQNAPIAQPGAKGLRLTREVVSIPGESGLLNRGKGGAEIAMFHFGEKSGRIMSPRSYFRGIFVPVMELVNRYSFMRATSYQASERMVSYSGEKVTDGRMANAEMESFNFHFLVTRCLKVFPK